MSYLHDETEPGARRRRVLCGPSWLRSQASSLRGRIRPERWLLGLSACIAWMVCAQAADATLMVTVFRTGDMTAEITATGFVPASSDRIRLIGATSVGDSGLDAFTGDFMIGDAAVTAVFVRSGQTRFEINFSQDFDENDTPTGTVSATLDVETWQPVGSTGTVLARDSTVLGTWAIVPEPATGLLLALGLSGIALRSGARRR